jgi:transposase
MNLNISNRNGRKYLYIEKSYRDVNGKPRKKRMRTLGYVDVLENEYEDPICYFKEVVRKMTEEEKKDMPLTLTINMKEELPEGATGTKNLGYALLLKVYHELEIDKFIKGKAQSSAFKFNTNSIMILLVMSRLLSPGSKKKAYDERSRYFERFDFTLDDVYRSLGHFDKISNEMQRFLHESVRAKYGSDTSTIYYDVTNYYFEINKPDDLRKYGVSKEKRKRPIVQLGLAMDKDGIPIHYELFPGNKLDKETFRSVIGNVRKNFNTGRVVVVADMGIITGDNIYYLVGENSDKPKNGYIFSFSVRGGTKKFQEYVLSEIGYTKKDGKPIDEDADFKIKWRTTPREINVTMSSGVTRKKTIHEKQVVFWSKKHCLKTRAERAEIIAKAEALAADPKKFTKATSYGAAAYVADLDFDKETGEYLDTGKKLFVDYAKIAQEEILDGYYAVVTSELHSFAYEIVDTYRGLWEIEETFKITKSDLVARPVYVHDKDTINAHFLSCFLALTIIRVIQKKIGKLYSAAKIVECLNKIECIHEDENIYLFGYRSPVSDLLGDAFGFDFAKKRLRLAEIKNIWATPKKQV